MSTRFIERIKKGSRFAYVRSGKAISSEEESRIKALAIPPAWRDVKVAASKEAKVQAQGIDAAGRKQYIYSEAHRAKQEAAKFERIMSFAKHLPKLREQLDKDLRRTVYDKSKVLACAVSLMDEAYFRVGNQQYAKEHESYGLTTLRSKHLSVDGDTVVFDFIGKSGQFQHKKISDARLSRIIKKLDDMPGYELFRYYDDNDSLKTLTSHDVNAYIKHYMGDDYSAKDFRTWGGTLLATLELAGEVRSETERERKKVITKCVKKVARRLGNTPAVARASYIDPRIFNHFHQSDTIKELHSTISKMKPQKYLSNDERCVMKLLSS